MAVQFDPIAKDESLNTTEQATRNIADVLAQELSGIATAISGGSDKAPKTDIATVEPTNVASRAYSIGELVYVNGNLYKVITAISGGATFTVGTNIQSTNVSGALKDMTISDGVHSATAEADITVREYIYWWKIGKIVVVDLGGISTNNSLGNVLITQDIPVMRSRPTCVLRNDTSQDTALIYGTLGTSQLRFSGGYNLNKWYYGQAIYLTD